MEPNETSEVNQASGTSIFWALLALALNAVTEPSRIRSLIRSPTGPGTATNSILGFDPLRSSPIFCAADAIMDILFFLFESTPEDPPPTTPPPDIPNETERRRLARRQDPDVLPEPVLATTQHSEPNTDNTASSQATLKLLAFFLGAVPQAIKLFSMKGIYGTQLCAAMFLAASVARAISYKSPSYLAANRYSLIIFCACLLVLTVIAQFVIEIWLYFNIAEAAARSWSYHVLSRFAQIPRMFYFFFSFLTILFNDILRGYVPTSKFYPLAVCTAISVIDVSTPWTKEPRSLPWYTKLTAGLYLIILGFIGCLRVSMLCTASGRVLTRLAAKRAARSGAHSNSSLSVRLLTPREAKRALTSILRHGIVWLKAVFVGLCNALDSHGEWLETWNKAFGASYEEIVLACGIFNLLTAVLYYLVVFDSTGTSSPSWTSVLG